MENSPQSNVLEQNALTQSLAPNALEDLVQKVTPKVGWKLIVARWLALSAVWLAGCGIWNTLPVFQNMLAGQTKTVLWNCSFVCVFALPLWELIQSKVWPKAYLEEPSQALVFVQTITKILTFKFRNLKNLADFCTRSLPEITYEEKQSILFFAVRLFFLPIMLNTFVLHIGSYQQPSSLNDFWLKLSSLDWLQDVVFFVDVIPFALAYMLNFGGFRTRSIDTNFVGWFFCLACYPPFNEAWGQFFAFNHNDYDGWWGWISLALIAVYSWASVSLGLKAGHLQYRGLCQSGPYALVRHPAYIFKTTSWWVGAIAWSVFQIQTSLDLKATILAVAFNTLAACFWTWIYHKRAVTEEAHLVKYQDYRDYCLKVKYRYIPGLI